MKNKVKSQIKLLHECGYSYREISKEVNYSVGQVWNIINSKPKPKKEKKPKVKQNYIPRDEMSPNRILSLKLGGFKGRSEKNSRVGKKTHSFTIQEVYEKFGTEPICYLTGEKIDLTDSKDYSLDHILPKSKGGDNSLDNLGFLKSNVNYAKSDMTVDEFIQLCINVLEYNGYDVLNREETQDITA